MERRSGWRRFGLVLVLMLAALPALAGERPGGRQRARSLVGEVWAAVVRWAVPSGLAKLGPGIDPDGLNGGAESQGPNSVQGGNGDLGADIDPDG